MNLFLIGWRPSGLADPAAAERALRALLERLPFFDSARIEQWHAESGRATMACVGHPPEQVGAVRYVDSDADGMALFSGRPFEWTGDCEADGRAPLDPRFYRRPALEWAADLDGRVTAARYEDRGGTLELYSDPLGAYPVFSGERDGTRWISNSAELVRTALGTREIDLSVLACLLAGGWSLSGEPVWQHVRRLPRGVVLSLRAGRPDTATELLPLERIAPLPGAGFEPGRTARLLVAATAALADWPGRPAVLQLSGGRDSRLLLAAGLRANVDVEVVTTGAPELPDVRVARELCEVAGKSPELRSPDPGGALHGATSETARLLGLTSGGAISLEDAGGYFSVPVSALPLLFNGQGGEIARAYYGNGDGLTREDLVSELFRAIARSGEILAASGRALVERVLARAVDEAIASGVARKDVPDVFYLARRMGSWAATGHGCVEYVKGDTICPLWSRRLLDQQLGLSLRERARGRFPHAALEALAPELARIPYAEPAPHATQPDGFAAVHEKVREAVAAQVAHPAWEVLERPYVRELLARDPRALDAQQRRHVWRLGTVFMGAASEPAA
ncbi:MAG: hypothetical protein ACRDL1_00305 [Solirubrobacterales bacterium]